MTHASCLCGQVTWELDGPLQLMSHCHCSRCRKSHGVGFATYVAGPEAGFRLRGRPHVRRWESSPGFFRCFCQHCGSVVPGDPVHGQVFVPAGNSDDDPDARALAHIFVAAKAPWVEITDALPQFAAYPAGVDMPIIADRAPLDPPGAPRGSCLCGGVAFTVETPPIRAHNCHCSRCRKARSAAHASNLFTAAEDLRFTRGEDLRVSYKVPEAQRFSQSFCRVCGSAIPHVYPERGVAVVPLGALDDDPGIRPAAHIFVASKAPWFEITDALPQFAEYPAS